MTDLANVAIENHSSVEKKSLLKQLLYLYRRASEKFSYLQSPFLLVVRLYWGWQLVQVGWAKLHHLEKIAGYFMSLNIPFPAANAYFVSGLEFFGGWLLIVGVVSRFTSLLLVLDMFVAYWTADRDALTSIFSNPGKFYTADPYTFLFASLIVLIFGAGLFSLDAIIARRFEEQS